MTEYKTHPTTGLKIAPTYGLHAFQKPNFKAGFAGSIPAALFGKYFDTVADAVAAAAELGWHCFTEADMKA